MSYYGYERRPGWSVINRSHGYLEPNLSYLSRRHTAIAEREGMTFMDYPMLPSSAPGERQVAKPPRDGNLRMGNLLKVGDIVLHRGQTGEVKYIGHLPGSPIPEDVYLGLEFPLPVGNSDGTYKGYRIFSAFRNFAGFYKASECMYRGESAAIYLPLDIKSFVDDTGRQVITTATGHIDVQYAHNNEREFYQQYDRLTRQVKEIGKILSKQAGHPVINPKVLPSKKRQPRYINYLPELKMGRDRSRQRNEDRIYNMDEATLKRTKAAQKSKPQSQPGPSRSPRNRAQSREHEEHALQISQNFNVPQPPPLHKYHQHISSGRKNLAGLNHLNGEMTQLVSLFRAPPPQGYYNKSERDSTTEVDEIFSDKQTARAQFQLKSSKALLSDIYRDDLFPFQRRMTKLH